MVEFFGLQQWQNKDERSARSFLASGADEAIVFFHDLLHNGQSDARSFVFAASM